MAYASSRAGRGIAGAPFGQKEFLENNINYNFRCRPKKRMQLLT